MATSSAWHDELGAVAQAHDPRGAAALDAVHAVHRDDLRAEPPRLGGGAPRQVAAAQPGREAEVVLDARALPGLARRAPRARPSPCAAPRRRRRPRRPARPGRRRRSPGRRSGSSARVVSPTFSATSSAVGRSSTAPSENRSTGSAVRADVGRPRAAARASRSRSTSSQRNGTWLRARKSRSSCASARAQRWPTTRMPSNVGDPARCRPVGQQVVEHRVTAAPRAGPRA